MRRESPVESHKKHWSCTLHCGLGEGSLNFGELLPIQGERLFHIHMPPTAQCFCCKPRMAVVPRGDDQSVDFLLRIDLFDAGGRFSEAELFSIMNGVQSICCHERVELGPGFAQLGNQNSSAIIPSTNATHDGLVGAALG